jgi:WD40 repeat protein
MRRLLVTLVLLIFTQQSFAQEQYPPLVGPVVYGQTINGGPIVFQDLGSNEVWETDIETLIQHGRSLSWSPNGCYLLYGYWRDQNYAVVDVQKRTTTEVDLPIVIEGEEVSMEGTPIWSPDGKRLAYSVFGGGNTTFIAYDLETQETELLYIREDYPGRFPATLRGWPSENILTYDSWEDSFEVNLETGQIRFLIPDERITLPIIPPFTYTIPSPNNEAIASYFNLSWVRNTLDRRFSYNTDVEIDAIESTIIERPGIEIYVVDTGETFFFDLSGQLVSAVKWSQDGSQLAILVWPNDDYETANGAFIYDFMTNTMSPVADLHPVQHTDSGEYGVFQPNWSADGEWVTLFGLEQGWVIYNLEQESIMPVAEPFQSSISMMEVSFSPVTHYELGACE